MRRHTNPIWTQLRALINSWGQQIRWNPLPVHVVLFELSSAVHCHAGACRPITRVVALPASEQLRFARPSVQAVPAPQRQGVRQAGPMQGNMDQTSSAHSRAVRFQAGLKGSPSSGGQGSRNAAGAWVAGAVPGSQARSPVHAPTGALAGTGVVVSPMRPAAALASSAGARRRPTSALSHAASTRQAKAHAQGLAHAGLLSTSTTAHIPPKYKRVSEVAC